MSGPFGMLPGNVNQPGSGGFVPKAYADVLADMQAAALVNVRPDLDLSDSSFEGKWLAVFANAHAQLWQVAAEVESSDDRNSAEGAAMDNIGDLGGVPREGESFTQVLANLTLAAGTYAAGSLVASVAGNASLQFSNPLDVTSSGGTVPDVLMQCTTIGPTVSINPGTLTVISPVTGWTAITNPAQQTQLGQLAETDAQYAVRQVQETNLQGSNTTGSMAAALIALGAAQNPPVSVIPNVLENETDVSKTVSLITLPPHSMAAIVYDGATPLDDDAIAQVVWQNKPPGTALVGTSTGTYVDPILGPQTVPFSRPSQVPIYIAVTVVILGGYEFANVLAAIQAALVAAAVAPTPTSGVAPFGQLQPGTPVVASQFQAVVMGVPGVFDVQSVFISKAPSPTTSTAISMTADQVGTVAGANVTVSQGTWP